MAPNSKIILIRHGQATHNLQDDFEQHDPKLTDLGKDQCIRLLRNAFTDGEWDGFEELELVVVSPLWRTIETAFLCFGKEYREKKCNFIVLPEVQETSPNPCDTGSPLEVLKKEFKTLDFSECERNEWLNKHHGFYTRSNLAFRATFVRKWLYERPEKVIAVVTHSGFLRWLTPQDFPQVEDRDRYRNCEYRGYKFAPIIEDDGDGGPFKLKEETWSVELRKRKRASEDNADSELAATGAAGGAGNPSGSLGGDGAFDDPEQPEIVF